MYSEKGKGGMAAVSATPQPEIERLGQQWDGPNRAARDLGQKWKVRPSINIPAESTSIIMDVDGPGCVQHIWITVDHTRFRDLILRIYWDGQEQPSVECPLGDFFCNGFNTRTKVLAVPINVTSSRQPQLLFPHAVWEACPGQNRKPGTGGCGRFFYAINIAATEIDDDDTFSHARFRHTNPLPYGEDYTILDGVKGKRQYVGTYMAWQQNNRGWWGEGKIKILSRRRR